MAQKKKQYTSAMDSVFDFIFTESKKPPGKVKPVKVTGLDANDPYIDAAMAVLEQPLMYINKTTEGAIKDVGDIALNKFEIDADGKGKVPPVKFSLSNIGSVLNNDFTFVDKPFERLEAARKSGRMTAFGNDMAAFTASGMASQLGLDKETQNVFLKVGKSGQDKNADYEMNVRSIHLASQSWEKNNYKNISKAQLESLYGKDKGTNIYNTLQSIEGKYQNEMVKPEDQRDFSNVFGEAGNRDMHLFLEGVNLSEKAGKARDEAQKLKPGSTQARRLDRQAKGYEEAQNILGVLHDNGKYSKAGGVEKYLIQKEADLRSLKNELQNLSGHTDQASMDRVKGIGAEIKGINTQVRNFRIQKTAYSLGAIESQMKSVQQLYEYTVGGGFIPAMISGDFFDARKNTMWGLQPRDASKRVSMSYLDKKGNAKATTYGGFLAKTGNNKFQQAYYDGMMDFYYKFTPKGIIENLTTGNNYARQAYKQKENLMEGFKNFSGLSTIDGIDWDKLFSAEGRVYLQSLQSDPQFALLLQFVDKNKEKFEKFNKLVATADKFNLVARVKKKIEESSLYKNTIGKLGEAIGNGVKNILLKMAKDDAAKGVIMEWFGEKAGMKGVSIAIKAAVKSFLAGATGGVSATLGWFVDKAVDIAIMVAMKAAKPIIKLSIQSFVFALVGIIGIIALIVMAPSQVMKTQGSYSHVAPYEITLGETDYIVPYSTEDGGIDGPGEWGGGPPLPDGVSCLLGSNDSYRCSQGPLGTFSHKTLNAIDIAYGGIFYAPSFCGKGNCVIEYYGDFSCTAIGAGNAITLTAEYKGNTYKFIMYHITLSSELSMGSQVSAGQAVGQILIAGTNSGCWTGPHLHLEIEFNGARVNPYGVMTGYPGSGGFGCNITPCP